MTKINHVISELSKICKEKRYSLVTAESCTGGGISYNITKNPESSFLLERGYIVYSFSSKTDILDVSEYTLQTFGLVSREVAIEMAENALKKSKSQISIAITGIDEESAEDKPGAKAGIIWVSCAGIEMKTISKKFEIKGSRKKFCKESIFKSLKTLVDFLK